MIEATAVQRHAANVLLGLGSLSVVPSLDVPYQGTEEGTAPIGEHFNDF